METLSESKPSLFISTPDIEPERQQVKEIADHPRHGRPSARVNPVSDSAERTASRDRFSQNYIDQRFPCKTVSYGPTKRAFDLLVAIVMLVIAAPIMVVAAILIKLTSKGPVLFKQIRVGQGGRYFWCYKFRSMCADAEAKKQKLMHLNEASGPVFKIKHDPRVTPVGF